MIVDDGAAEGDLEPIGEGVADTGAEQIIRCVLRGLAVLRAAGEFGVQQGGIAEQHHGSDVILQGAGVDVVEPSGDVEFEGGLDALMAGIADIADGGEPTVKGDSADLVVHFHEEHAGIPVEGLADLPANAEIVLHDVARIEVVGHQRGSAGGHGLGEYFRAVRLRGIAVEFHRRLNFPCRAEAKQGHGVVVVLVAQRCAFAGFGDVDIFLDFLPDVFEAEAGGYRDVAEDKTVFHEHGRIVNSAVAVIADLAVGGVGGRAAFFGARGIDIVVHRTEHQRMFLVPRRPGVAGATFDGRGVEFLQFDGVAVGVGPGRQGAESAAALALAVARIEGVPGLDLYEGVVGQVVIHRDGSRIALEFKPVVKTRRGVAVFVVVDHAFAGFEGQPAGFAMFFVVHFGHDGPACLFRGGKGQFDAASEYVVIAVRLAETIGFAIVHITEVADAVGGSADRIIGRIEVIAAERVTGVQRNRHIAARFGGDVVQHAAGLGAVHQRAAAADEVDAFHGFHRGHIVGFRITKHVGVDRNAVLQHLGKLGAVGRQAAIAEA